MISKLKNNLIISGIIAPIFIAIITMVIGYFHPDYNHITQYMSELGAVNAPYAYIMNTSLTIFGLLLICFSYALNKASNKNKLRSISFSSLLVAISGLSFFLIGFFPCDPNCINVTTTGLIHVYLSDSAQYSLIIAPLFLLNALKRDNKLQDVYYYTLVNILLGIFFCFVYKTHVFENYTGLFQRISFGLPILWVEIMSIKIFKSKIQIKINH